MKSRRNPFLAIALTLAVTTALPAATLTWDITSGDSAVTGGTGDWNTSNSNWTSDAGTTNVSWPSTSTNDDDAVFSGTGGTVTIDAGGITANDITISSTGYILGGGTLTLDSLDPDGAGPLLPPAPVITASQSATINAAITSPNGLAKSGGATLILGGNLSQVVGTMTIDGAIASPVNNNGGIQLQSGVSTAGLTGIDIKNNSFLALAGVSLGSTTAITLNGGGGTQAPQGAIRGTSGINTVAGSVVINDSAVRIGNTGTSTTFSGPITAVNPAHGLLVRIGSNQGVILSNTSNSWGGTTTLGEGSLYCAPGALPSTSNLAIGTSAGADFGTNGSFTRPIGTAAGQVQFGRAADGLRPMGFSARGGALTVNIGGEGEDFTFLPVTTAATTNGTFANNSSTVTVASATGIATGMYVSGTGLAMDSRVTAISGTTVTLSRATVAASAASPGNALTFTTLAALDNTKFNTYTLVLNGANADSALTFQNPVDLNGFTRFLQVSANTATLTGGLKNTSANAASARKTGAGTLIHDPGSAHAVTLAGLNTNAGTLEMKSGTITVNGSGTTSQSDGTNGFVVARGGTFRLNGATVNVTGGGSLFPAGNTNGGNSSFILDSGTFDGGTKEALNAYGANGTTTINAGLFICGDFRVGQSSTCALNLNGGTLRANLLKDASATTATVRLNGGTLQAKANQTAFIDAGLDSVLVQAEGAVIDSNGFNVTIPKLLAEDTASTGGGLEKKGGGILDLTADNTYTGDNLIRAGVLRVGSTGNLGAPAATVTVDGGEFGVSGTAISSITSLGRTFTYLTGGFHVADASHTLDVDIDLTGSGGLSKSGPGTITLSGANDFSGNLACGSGATGWIEVDSATDLGTGPKTGNFTASSQSGTGGIRLLGGITATEVDLSISGRNVDPETQQVLWNVSGNNNWPGDILIASTGGTYYLRSDAGTLELAGTLGNTIAASGTPDTRIFNLQGPGNYLVSGTIVDGSNANRFVGLSTNGSGTVTLTGANTYTGTTTVSDGVLLVNGDNSAATGAVTVNGDAVLGGTGTLGGAVTVTTDAKLAPGTSAGTLTTSANVSGAGTLEIELDGSVADKLVLTGSGAIDISGLKLNIAQLVGGATEPVYVIVDSAAAISGAAFASFTGVPDGYTLTYNYNDGTDSNNIALVSANGSQFTNWATTTNGLTGGDAAPGADPDNDGLDNAIEFVIGGQPNPANPNAASNDLAPTIDASGANLVFTFRRTDLALTQPGIAITVEYGSDLAGWTTAQDGVNGISIVPTNDVPETGIDTVVVTIPKALAGGTSMFARLNVVIP